jgi:hypothetical protein
MVITKLFVIFEKRARTKLSMPFENFKIAPQETEL